MLFDCVIHFPTGPEFFFDSASSFVRVELLLYKKEIPGTIKVINRGQGSPEKIFVLKIKLY